MKFQIVILSAVLALATTEYHGNGQPGCRTSEELSTQLFRNTWDPTAYWKCSELNAPAELIRCPDNTGFIESSKSCVNWSEWQWVPPVAPPSEVLEVSAGISADVESPSASFEGSAEEAQ